MGTATTCALPDASAYNKFVTFLKCPDALDADYEINTRDWSKWTVVGTSYAKVSTATGGISTSGGRQVEMASQAHSIVDAVFECPWGSTTRTVDHGHAIRRKTFDGFDYWQIVAAINVNEDNMVMRFVCRKVTPNGVM